MEEKRELFLFYGHKGSVKKACFSQWFIREFEVDGVKYCCMEQYMMAQKAWMFRDVKRLSQILSSKDPKIWLGQNLLGYALTRVKETLQASEK
ncbi:MAG: NADAR family protein [Bacteroidales bacterium]|nr:NADAR family protein [Bacteroidales bacterium]